MDQFVIPAGSRRTDGAFVPAHVGELTQIVTPALVDEVLAATRRVQHRVRLLPSRVVVYFVLGLALFGECGYRGVWASLVARFGATAADPSAAALRQARRRVGVAPLAALFDRVRGTVADSATPGAWWRGLRLVAWDGTCLEAAGSAANAAHFGHITARNGPSGYPLVRLCALVECGTRTVINAVFGPWRGLSEAAGARRLTGDLGSGMLLLADRGYDSYPLLRAAADTGADLLWRLKSDRVLPTLRQLPDGSSVSMIVDVSDRARLRRWARQGQQGPPPVEGLWVRVIEAVITTTSEHGRATTSTLRLITTLTDHERYPAGELARLYHQRWEIETAYRGLKVTLKGAGRVLRSHTPNGITQEIYAYLTVYHAARLIGTRAAEHAGIDPDRISLTVTLRTARHTVINASGTTGMTSTIRTAVLNPRDLGPQHRRPRILPRRVKRTISPFAYNPSRHNKPQHNTTITIAITKPDTDLTNSPAP